MTASLRYQLARKPMKIRLHPAETIAAIAAYVSTKTGRKVEPSQVCIWHDPNDSDLDNLNGIGIEVALGNLEEGQ